MTPTIAVIIPTVGGRPSLINTVASCVDADQILVTENTLGGYGHPARNYELDMSHVATDYVVSIDDDDEFISGAFDAIRVALIQDGRWFVFRMMFGDGSHCPGVTVWNEKRIRQGNIGTPMIVWPATAAARWGMSSIDLMGRDLGAGYFGDYDMAVALEAELGPPVWIDHVIATVRPRVVEPVA